MKATQNRINRETPRGGLRPIVYVAMPVIAMVLGLGVHAVYASCISPTGTQETASGKVKFVEGGATVTCTTAVKFTPPSGSASCTPPDPVCVDADSVAFTGCSGTILGINFSASLSVPAGCTWQVCISGDGTDTWLRIPQACLIATATISGSHCSTTAFPAGAGEVTGSWNNTSSFATFPSQSVPVTTSGGFPCPSATSATFSSSTNITVSPSISIN